VEELPLHFGQTDRYVSGTVSVVVGYLNLVLRSSGHYTGVTTTGFAQVDVKTDRYVSGPVSVVVGYLNLVLRSSGHYTGVTTTGFAQVDVKNNVQVS